MTRGYEYVLAVVRRFPDPRKLELGSAQLLANDIKQEIEDNHLSFDNEDAFWRHVEACISNDVFEAAYRKLKRNYKVWLRLHPDK